MNTTTLLDPNGAVIRQQNTSSETDSQLNSTLQTESARATIRGPNGVEGIATLHQEGDTKIVTNVETTDATGRTTQRQIERDIATERDLASRGSIETENLASGGKAFNLSSIEVDQRSTTDATRNGNQLTTQNTETVSGKTVSGNIAYTPAQQASDVNAPNAQINVNFGSFTGIASGFQLDSGEVNFSLEFHGANMTEQSTTRTVANGTEETVAGQNTVKSGEMQDATFSGKLRSSVTEDGTRVIEVVAAYRRAGAKFVSEGGANPEEALSTGETDLEVMGRVEISQDGTTRNIESSFDVSRVTTTDAQGWAQTL